MTFLYNECPQLFQPCRCQRSTLPCKCRVPQVKPPLSLSQRRWRLNWAMEKDWTVGQWSKVLYSVESVPFCLQSRFKGLEEGGEEQNPSCLSSSGKYPVSQSVGWNVRCRFLKSKVTASVYLIVLEACMIPSAEDLYGETDFYLPAGPGPCPYCQKPQNLVLCPCHHSAWLASQLSRPKPHWESMGYYRERKMSGTRPKRSIKEITPTECHSLVASMSRHIEAVNKAKGHPKYWTLT